MSLPGVKESFVVEPHYLLLPALHSSEVRTRALSGTFSCSVFLEVSCIIYYCAMYRAMRITVYFYMLTCERSIGLNTFIHYKVYSYLLYCILYKVIQIFLIPPNICDLFQLYFHQNYLTKMQTKPVAQSLVQ